MKVLNLEEVRAIVEARGFSAFLEEGKITILATVATVVYNCEDPDNPGQFKAGVQPEVILPTFPNDAWQCAVAVMNAVNEKAPQEVAGK